MTTLTPRELMARAKAGDVDAFSQLYTDYRRSIMAFLLRRTHNPQLAEDLTQDTFVRALKAIGNWQWQDKNPGAWLTTIARNLLADYLKSSHHQRSTTVPEFVIEVADTGREGDPETAVINQLRDTTLLNALWLITAEQRDCLLNRYVRELSIPETAEIMGITEGAVKSGTLRGVRSLARHLDRELVR